LLESTCAFILRAGSRTLSIWNSCTCHLCINTCIFFYHTEPKFQELRTLYSFSHFKHYRVYTVICLLTHTSICQVCMTIDIFYFYQVLFNDVLYILFCAVVGNLHFDNRHCYRSTCL
jgi:hypothetical protein